MKLLDDFSFVRILKYDTFAKSISLLGSIEGKDAILTLTKTAFSTDPDKYSKYLGIEECRSLASNDVYHWYVGTYFQSLNSPQIKIDLIYPATPTHLKKFSPTKDIVVTETPQMYRQIVVPYIRTMLGPRIRWVHEILFHGAEADRVVYRDDDQTNGFVLLPDMKWDGANINELYLVAIVLRKDLQSVRDLNYSHIEFLEKTRDKILGSVNESYGLEKNRLKLYFHYQPSYYHLHIHVANVRLQQSDFGRSILLDNVIEQLRYLGQKGYSQLNLTYIIRSDHDLVEDFEKFDEKAANSSSNDICRLL